MEVTEDGPRGASVPSAQAQTLPRNHAIKQKYITPGVVRERPSKAQLHSRLLLSLVRGQAEMCTAIFALSSPIN